MADLGPLHRAWWPKRWGPRRHGSCTSPPTSWPASSPSGPESWRENFRFPNVFDTTAARTDLGFRYTVPFLEGVRRTVAWLDSRGLIDGAADADPDYDRLLDLWERLGQRMTAELAEGEQMSEASRVRAG